MNTNLLSARSDAATTAAITFFVLPGFSMLPVCSAIEALLLANRVVGYEAYRWRLVSEHGGSVRSSGGASMIVDRGLDEERRGVFATDAPSLVVICADAGAADYSNKRLEAWLRECRRQRTVVGSFGGGSYVLAKAGLLVGKRCSIHWEYLPGFAERFIDAKADASIYHLDDGVMTCAGGTASFDAMLYLIRRRFDERTAAGICEHAVIDRGRSADERQRLPLAHRCGVFNEAVVKIIRRMEQHIVDPVPMNDLAAHVDLSRRQVERLFQLEVGCSPVRYYLRLRLERARLLLSQSAMPIVDVAIACGFISASHFSRSFREAIGSAPHEIRKNRANAF